MSYPPPILANPDWDLQVSVGEAGALNPQFMTPVDPPYPQDMMIDQVNFDHPEVLSPSIYQDSQAVFDNRAPSPNGPFPAGLDVDALMAALGYYPCEVRLDEQGIPIAEDSPAREGLDALGHYSQASNAAAAADLADDFAMSSEPPAAFTTISVTTTATSSSATHSPLQAAGNAFGLGSSFTTAGANGVTCGLVSPSWTANEAFVASADVAVNHSEPVTQDSTFVDGAPSAEQLHPIVKVLEEEVALNDDHITYDHDEELDEDDELSDEDDDQQATVPSAILRDTEDEFVKEATFANLAESHAWCAEHGFTHAEIRRTTGPNQTLKFAMCFVCKAAIVLKQHRECQWARLRHCKTAKHMTALSSHLEGRQIQNTEGVSVEKTSNANAPSPQALAAPITKPSQVRHAPRPVSAASAQPIGSAMPFTASSVYGTQGQGQTISADATGHEGFQSVFQANIPQPVSDANNSSQVSDIAPQVGKDGSEFIVFPVHQDKGKGRATDVGYRARTQPSLPSLQASSPVSVGHAAGDGVPTANPQLFNEWLTPEEYFFLQHFRNFREYMPHSQE